MRIERFLCAAAAVSLAVAAPLFAQDSTFNQTARRKGAVVFDSSALRRLPIDGILDVPVLVPGVYGLTDPRAFSVRGGQPGDVPVYVDGALIRSGQRHMAELLPPVRGIESLSFWTGLAPVALGNAKAGLLEITTPSAGRDWTADVRYRADDAQFDLWRNVGFHRLEATAGGPLPAGFSVFAALQLDGQQSLESEKMRDVQAPVYITSGTDTTIRQPMTVGDPNSDTMDLAVPRFVQYSGYCDESRNGSACRGLQVPFTTRGGHTLQAKLQRSYGANGRVSLTLLSGRQQQRDVPFTDLYNPSNRTAFRTDSRALILDWRHALPSLGGRPLRLNVNLSYQTDERVAGSLTVASEVESRDLSSGFLLSSFDFVVDETRRHDVTIAGTTHRAVGYLDDTQISCLLAGQAFCLDLVPFLDRNDLISAQPYRMNPYAAEQSLRFPLYSSGLDNPFDMRRERRVVARVGIGWEVAAAHELTAGFDLARFDTRRYAAPMISAVNVDAYVEKPMQTGVYMQDRLRLGKVEILGSLRLDRLDTRALYPIVPGRISSITDTIAVSGTDTFRLAPFDPEDPTANFRRANAHTVVSPQLRMSFEAWPGAVVRFTAGRQVQAPDFQALFTHKNTDISQGNSTTVFGRDEGLQHLDLVELAAHVDLGRPGTSADIAIYSQDLTGEAFHLTRFADPGINGFPRDFRVFTTSRPGKLRGIDLSLERRVSELLSGSISISHQGGQALDGSRTFAAATAAITFGDHAPLGSALQHTSVYAMVRVATNRHYTLQRNSGDGLTIDDGALDNVEPENSSSLPLFKTIDVRVTRAVSLGRMNGVVFIESNNLLNWTNLTDIFTETGETTNPQHRSRWVAEQVAQLQSEAAQNGLARTLPSGEPAVDLQASGVCAGWTSRNVPGTGSGGPADCVFLQRAERRFGNGDGMYTLSEYSAAFGGWYDLVNASYRFNGPGRRIRLGVQLGF